MKTTISTHFGSNVSLAHNRREKQMVEHENEKWAKKYPGEVRIQPDGDYEILKDVGSLTRVYHDLFDEAVKEWNDRQAKKGNNDRIIKNYLSEIKAKEGKSEGAKHPIYEMIVAVGSRDAPIEKEVSKQILREYCAGFEERNKNLYVVVNVIHADESGSVHAHISFVPVAYNMNRGMHTQNSIKNALKQQGFDGEADKKYDNAMIRWEKSENMVLESICNRYGFEIDHYMAGSKVKHLEDEEYKLQKKIEVLESEIAKKEALPLGKTIIKKARLDELQEIEKKYKDSIPAIEQAKRDLHAASISMQAYSKAYAQLQKDKDHFEEKVNEAANKKIEHIKDKALEFIKSMGMWEKFMSWSLKAVEKVKQSLKY